MPQGDELPTSFDPETVQLSFNVNVILKTLSQFIRSQRHIATFTIHSLADLHLSTTKRQQNANNHIILYIFQNVTVLAQNVTEGVTTKSLIINGNNRAESDL
jgi:hypothetical protein